MAQQHYGFGCTLPNPMDEAVRKTTEALKTEGFGVLTTIDVQATMKAKLGIDQPPYIISPQAVEQAIKNRAQLAGIPEAEMFKTHDLRRTYISNLLDSSGDLVAIQGLAGHANINTTAGYDRRGIRAQEEAAQTIHVPYQRPPE